MQRQYSTVYTIGFSAAVCIVCSLLVSATAVCLKQRQENNAVWDVRTNVLLAAGLVEPAQDITPTAISSLFAERIKSVVVDLKDGKDTDIDPSTFDQREAARDPQRSRQAPPNPAQVSRVPDHALVYKVLKDGRVDEIILPVEGKGLWSTLYGFIALDSDTTTIRGITFYEHGETPGLGGEVDNPKWKARWPGRKAYDEDGNVRISVIKGAAGPVETDPYRVDGLSGATITSRGVNHLVQFWLSEHGFAPYLKRFRESRSGSK